MQKSLTAIVIQLAAVGTMLLGYASAQGTPPAASGQSSAGTAPKAATTKKTPTTARTATPYTLKTPREKAGYALGAKIGGDLRRQGVNEAVDPATVARGIKDALAGTKSLMTDDEVRAALTQLAESRFARSRKRRHTRRAARTARKARRSWPRTRPRKA